MALTSIANQLTPGRPTQITFAPNTGLPNDLQSLGLIGHMNASGMAGSGSMSATGAYVAVDIVNVADPVAAQAEAEGFFGAGSELAKMVVAAVAANQQTGNFPPITAIPLNSSDTGYGQALTTVDKLPLTYLVSPYDGNSNSTQAALITQAGNMSAPSRVQNNQFGSFAVAANRNAAASALFKYDSQYATFAWLPDSGSPTMTLGEEASAYAAMLAGNQIPFNPLNNQVIPNIPAPANRADWISVGAGMQSETALTQGWTPLRVLPNGNVAIVRARTTRVTTDGTTPVTAYFDVMDFNVLYYWRQTLVTRFNQPDLMQAKASQLTASLVLSEVIRLATLFEEQGMFQAIAELAKQFVVQRNITDRSRFDVFTPVNVVPGLMVLATNVSATVQGDVISV